MRTAAARRASSAPSPAIRCASASTSGASDGSASTGRLRPWRSALRATIALPARVRGPVLRAALARLVASNLSLARGLAGEPLPTPDNARVMAMRPPARSRVSHRSDTAPFTESLIAACVGEPDRQRHLTTRPSVGQYLANFVQTQSHSQETSVTSRLSDGRRYISCRSVTFDEQVFEETFDVCHLQMTRPVSESVPTHHVGYALADIWLQQI
jgi:hypothetical protein